MKKAESWEAIDAGRVAIADLLERLTPEEWEARSLCTGWSVKDVAAHLTLAATATVREIVGGVVRSRGNFDRTIRDVSIERSAARTTDQVIADLRGIVGSRRLAPTTFWRDPLLDVLVHGQDLSRPIGRHLPMPTEPARVAADWAWQRGFPFFPSRRFRGITMVAEDCEWQRGDGAVVRGPVGSLLLLSTGRYAAVADLSGPGLARLQRPSATATNSAP